MSEPQPSIHLMISYSRTDSKFVDRLEKDLKKRGYKDVWVDRRKLEGGQQWDIEIQNAIDKCDVLLLVLSPAALDSPFVKQEYERAIEKGKQVIPLRYHPTSTLPPDLAQLQQINIQADVNFEKQYKAGIRELMQALATHAKRQAEKQQKLPQAPQVDVSFGSLASAVMRSVWARPEVRWVSVLALILMVVPLGALLVSQVQEHNVLREVAQSHTATVGAIETQRMVSYQTLVPQETAQAATAAAIASQTEIAQAATATVVFASPYTALRPGPCDAGGASWTLFENSGQFPGKISCTSKDMLISGNAVTYFHAAPGHAGFTPQGAFPLHYRASVTMTLGSSGSVGMANLEGDFGGIAQWHIGIRQDGWWYTSLFNSSQYGGGESGYVRTAASYSMVMVVQGGYVTWLVNGVQVDKKELTSATMQPTGVALGDDPGGLAYFKDFVFTPLL